MKEGRILRKMRLDRANIRIKVKRNQFQSKIKTRITVIVTF
jgi:uncharacterized OsmC-like protein